MFTQAKCIPCQGGIPPLNANEIEPLLKLIDNNWSVIDDKELIRKHQK